MGILKNQRHEAFAVAIAKGENGVQAYKKIYPKSKNWKVGIVDSTASRLRRKVLERIRELQTVEVSSLIASRQEVAERLTSILRDGSSDMASIAAADRLCKLVGYNEPERVSTSITFKPDDKVFDVLTDR